LSGGLLVRGGVGGGGGGGAVVGGGVVWLGVGEVLVASFFAFRSLFLWGGGDEVKVGAVAAVIFAVVGRRCRGGDLVLCWGRGRFGLVGSGGGYGGHGVVLVGGGVCLVVVVSGVGTWCFMVW